MPYQCNKNPPGHCCAPSLFHPVEKHTDGSRVIEKSCALVLIALGDDNWWGRYLLDKEEKTALRKEVEEVSRKKRKEFADRKDDLVTLLELKDFANDETNKKKILKHSSAIHGLARVEFVEQVFHEYDTSKDGGLDPTEWDKFLDTLSWKNLEFLLGIGFLNFRAFWGRRQTWDLHPEAVEWDVIQQDLIRASGSFGRKCGFGSSAMESSEEPLMNVTEKLPNWFQLGFDPDCDGWNPFPQGWWKDFHYYSANNHPFHGMLMCSPVHPLSWIERVFVELATIGFSTCTAVWHLRWVEHNKYPIPFLHNPFMFSLLMVTIPGMMIWWALFILFTCKCGHVNSATSTPAEEKRAWRKRTVAATLGYIICIVGLLMLGSFFMFFHLTTEKDLRPYYRMVFVGRIKSYVIFWFLALFIYFNPVIAWGTTDPEKPQTGIGDLIGLGQWRIEKQRFQVRCVNVANKREAMRHDSTVSAYVADNP